MKVCIVEASGKLGQCLVQHQLDRGYEFVGVPGRASGTSIDSVGASNRSGCGPGPTNRTPLTVTCTFTVPSVRAWL